MFKAVFVKVILILMSLRLKKLLLALAQESPEISATSLMMASMETGCLKKLKYKSRGK